MAYLSYWPYRGEGFTFFNGHFWDTLISYRKGLFIYTPFIFIAILSSLGYIKKSFYSLITFLGFFTMLNLVLSAWTSWDYGGCFSLRPFLEFYPLFIIPISVFLENIRQRVAIYLISILFFAILCLSVIQTYQYEKGIIHFSVMDKEKYWKVFLKTDRRLQRIYFKALEKQVPADSLEFISSVFNNFDGNNEWNAKETLQSFEYYSPDSAVKIDSAHAFSPCYASNCSTLFDQGVNYVHVKAMAKLSDDESNALLVISLEKERNHEIFKYVASSISLNVSKAGEWQEISCWTRFPWIIPSNIFKVYAWNQSSSAVYIDDIRIDFYKIRTR